MAQRIFHIALFGVALAVFSGFVDPYGVTAADFSRDIQPLLAKRCFACHGPDTQEAGLRFDSAEAATTELDSGYRAIVPSDVDASEILSRGLQQTLISACRQKRARLTADEVSGTP